MHRNQAKLPYINKSTKFLCFDLESNGLHGQAFAVGGLVIDSTGKTHDELTARIPVTSKMDPWVKENVLPVIDDMPITHRTYDELCEVFWQWFVAAQKKADYVLVSNGYPVEYRFLLDCQGVDIEERYWQHPFPIIDLASLLLPLSQQKDATKTQLTAKVQRENSFRSHHPLDDAKATALVAFEALRATETIKN